MKLSLNEQNDVRILRNLVIMMFAFYAFLRYDDLSQLRFCDVDIFNTNVKLFIAQAKNDKNWSGQNVEFTLDTRCAEILRKYVKYCKMPILGFDRSDLFFFCKYKDQNLIFNEKLPYKDCRLAVLELCKAANIDVKRVGTHSMRIGAATEATDSGVPNHVIDIHGRWAVGSTARAGYQRMKPNQKSLISDALNKA